MRVVHFAKVIILGIAVALLVLNVIGVLLDWRMKSVVLVPSAHPFGNSLTEEEFYNTIRIALGKNAGGVDREELIRKIHSAVNRRMIFPADELIPGGKEVLRMPIWRNYLLFFAGLVLPKYRYYEHCTYRRAIRRQVGLCSQHVLVFAQILSENGIQALTVGLDGHVVATAEVAPGVWWTYDPTYGVIVPHSMAVIEEDPTIVIPFYMKEGYTPIEAANVADIYGREGNAPYHPSSDCGWRNVTYAAIWLIPVGLLLLFFFVPLTWRFITARRRSVL